MLSLGLAAALVLILAAVPFAQPASAIVVCEACLDVPPSTLCLGFCDGGRYLGPCSFYIASGCPLIGFLADVEGDSKEAFLASLREQVGTSDAHEEQPTTEV